MFPFVPNRTHESRLQFCQWATGNAACTTTGENQDQIVVSNAVWKMDRDGKISMAEVQAADGLDDVLEESAHEDWHDMDTLRCIAGTALMRALVSRRKLDMPWLQRGTERFTGIV